MAKPKQPKKPWWHGKTVNPEFRAVSRAHAGECTYCGSAPYTSERDHKRWRVVAEEHIGRPLPPTFLEEPASNPNNSKAQMASLDRAKDGYQPEAPEGIICRKGCGTRIVGGLKDIDAHNAEVHPNG